MLCGGEMISRPKFHLVFLLLVVFIGGLQAESLYVTGTNAAPTYHYIRADAPAGGDGSNWTQAWTELPATLQRGHVYYLADGN